MVILLGLAMIAWPALRTWPLVAAGLSMYFVIFACLLVREHRAGTLNVPIRARPRQKMDWLEWFAFAICAWVAITLLVTRT